MLGATNPEKIRELVAKLSIVMDDYLVGNQVSLGDVFLASHNLHKNVVLRLEQLAGDKDSVWRNIAVTSLDEVLKATPPL